MGLVREILTHPRVYPHITDDGCPPPEEFQPLDHPSVWYVLVREADELLGLWMFVPQNAITWEVHTCLLPCAWGARAKRAAKEMAAWVFAHTACRRIVTTVPADNRLALRFAVLAGMTEYGRNPHSFLKHGQLLDTHLLGLSKQCQQQ